jgi:excisionase family DNA binding protein
MSAELLTTAQAAAYLKISIPTLRRWTKAGLPVIRRGQRWRRYERADLDRWLTEHKHGDTGEQTERPRSRSFPACTNAETKALLAKLRLGGKVALPD